MMNVDRSNYENFAGPTKLYQMDTRSDGLVNNPPPEARRQTYRLASFQKCPDISSFPISPMELTSAGYFYIGPPSKLQCFCCGFYVESFTATDDIYSLQWHKEDCKFALGEESGNISIGDISGLGNSSNIASTSRNVASSYVSQPPPVAQTMGPLKKISPKSLLWKLAPIFDETHKQLVMSLDLYKEIDRRKTYIITVWPETLHSLVASLAENGFFFLGNLDRTQCISCGAVLKNWLVDDVVSDIHRKNFPLCRLVQNNDPKNIPLVEDLLPHSSSSSLPFKARAPMSYYGSGEGSALKRPFPGSRQYHLLQDEENLPSTSQDWLHRQLTSPERSKSLPGAFSAKSDIKRREPNVNSILNTEVSVANTIQISTPTLDNSSNVLLTPPVILSHKSPLETSHTNINTFALNSELSFQTESFRTSPTAPSMGVNTSQLMRDLDPFAPVMGESSERVPPLPASELDVDNDYVSPEKKIILREKYSCQEPKTRSMVYLGQRISTFRAPWPEGSSRSTITEVAEAGFRYLGIDDHVQCWYCGVEATNWASQYNAWDQHARLYPSCQYLLRNRGTEFVESVIANEFQDESGRLTPVEHNSVTDPSSMHSSTSFQLENYIESGPDRLPTPPIVDPRLEATQNREELQRAMASQMVTDVINMGFSRNHIRKVVKRQVEQCTVSYQTLAALVDALISTEQDLIDLSDEEAGEDTEEPHVVTPTAPSNNEFSFEDVDDDIELYRAREDVGAQNPGRTSSREQPSSNQLPTDTQNLSEERSQHSIESSSQHPSLGSGENRAKMQTELRRLREERRCKVCLDHPSDMVFVPCGHICACMTCTQSLRKCPVCRRKIDKAYKTYAT